MFNGPVFNNETIQSNARAVNGGGISESLDEANALYSRLTGASFELVPSSYKGGTLYSGAPGANGDLSWTRGSDAFRTNASGVLQRMPWNLLQYSEQFDNVYWGKTNSTVTSNTTISPSGNQDADTFTDASGSYGDVYAPSISITPNATYTVSVFIKKTTGALTHYPGIGLLLSGSANRQDYSIINTTTGQVVRDASSNINSVSYSTQSVNDYWRVVITFTDNQLNNSLGFRMYPAISSNGTSISSAAQGSNVFWGAQLVEGTTAQTYLPTTDRLNFPRLSYMYGSCPAVLAEPQRTNLVQRSDEFDNAYWSKYLATVSANNATSPDGSTNADLVYPSSTGPITGQLFRQISTGISSGNVVTVSAFVKASGKNFAYLSEIQNSFTPAAYFNLTTGAITNISAGVTASMTQLTNSWWRISITSTAGAGLYYVVVGSTDSAGSNINTASGTNGILVYGYQVEVGAYPTTYIPTTSATATRVADSFSRSNIYTNGLISASGGTWFVSLVNNVAYTRDNTIRTGITDDTTNFTNALFLLSSPSSRLSVNKLVGGAFTSLYNTNADITKLAIKWNGTTADIFANGTKVISATSFTPTNMQFLHSQGVGSPMFIQQMALFPTPLSDADCASLTADYTDGTSIVGNYERYVSQRSGAVENLSGVTNLIQNLK